MSYGLGFLKYRNVEFNDELENFFFNCVRLG